MGAGSSKETQSGTLRGAYAPPIPGIALPPSSPKQFTWYVPAGKKGGDMTAALIEGIQRQVRIPVGKKPGDAFTISAVSGNIQKVFASTLHSIPGMEVVYSKPVIFGTVTYTYEYDGSSFFTQGQRGMGSKVGTMMQEAQESILQQALQVECNDVLGMQFTVSNDSSGEWGNYKMVNVTAYGTPCVVVPAGNLPVVEASAIIEPLYNTE